MPFLGTPKYLSPYTAHPAPRLHLSIPARTHLCSETSLVPPHLTPHSPLCPHRAPFSPINPPPAPHAPNWVLRHHSCHPILPLRPPSPLSPPLSFTPTWVPLHPQLSPHSPFTPINPLPPPAPTHVLRHHSCHPTLLLSHTSPPSTPSPPLWVLRHHSCYPAFTNPPPPLRTHLGSAPSFVPPQPCLGLQLPACQGTQARVQGPGRELAWQSARALMWRQQRACHLQCTGVEAQACYWRNISMA